MFVSDGTLAPPQTGIVDISNTTCLGKTEVEIVQSVTNSLQHIINMEKRLESGKSIDDLMPELEVKLRPRVSSFLDNSLTTDFFHLSLE